VKKSTLFLFVVFLSVSCVSSMTSARELKVKNVDPIVFLKPDEVRFDLELLDFQGNESLDYKIVDFEGSEIDRGSINISDTTIIKPNLHGKMGYFALEISFRRGFFQRTYIDKTFAVIQQPRGLSQRIGMCMHFDNVLPNEARRELQAISRIGIGIVRGFFDWMSIEQREGQFYWTAVDAMAGLLNQMGMSVLGNINFFPRWASGAPGDIDDYIIWSRVMPDDAHSITEFAQTYARMCAERYGDLVKYWQIGNEVDAELFFKGRYSNMIAKDSRKIISDYVDFLKAASEGIRAADVDIPVVMGSMTQTGGATGLDHQPFLKTALEFGAHEYCDFISAHYLADLEEIRSVFRAQRLEPMEILVTEFGGPSLPGGTLLGHKQQIRDDIRHAVIQLSMGAVAVFKHHIRDIGMDPNYNEHNYGVLRPDFSVKPSYVSLANLVYQLEGLEPQGKLDLNYYRGKGRLVGYRFSDDTRTVNVMWLDGVNKAEIVLKVDTDSLVISDVMGNRTSLETNADNEVTYTIGDLPIFVVGELL
jgi:hypothetical protein